MAPERATEIVPSEAAAVSDGQTGDADEPTPRLFTVDEYYKMAEAGILRPDERVQLIEGKIITMPAIGSRHAYNVRRLMRLFDARVRDRAGVHSQSPIRLANGGEPEPDVAIVTLDPSDPKAYESRHPIPSETLLVLEVSDSTLSLDLGEKAAMYALHGITDYWVVDLMGHRVVIHRDPTPDGYTSVRSLESGETVSPLAFSDIMFTIDEILG